MTLSMKSVTQLPKGLREGYAAFYHNYGTFLSKNDKNIFYNVMLITTVPFIAFCKSPKLFFITFMSLLNL